MTGRCDGVPWVPFTREAVVAARDGDRIVLVHLDLNAAGVRCTEFPDLSGRPMADLEVEAAPVRMLGGDAQDVRRLEAAQLTLQSAAALGAMEYATRLASEHAATRTQFGKPLRAFQAVAHHLARMAAEVALARTSVELAAAEVLRGGPGHRARACHIQISHSAGLVARTAHQVLGALGITQEHPLNRATLRLWSWRDSPIATTELAAELGEAVHEAGPDALWEWLIHATDELTGKSGS